MYYKILIVLVVLLGINIVANDIDKINFTPQELEYIKKIKKRGSLRIVTRKRKTVYELQKDGTVKGVWYSLAVSFAKFINVKTEVTFVKSMNDFFLQDGKVPDGLKEKTVKPYTPDHLKKADLYVYTITKLPWRERIVRFIDIIPTKIMLVKRKSTKVNSIKDLDGLKVAVEPNTSQETQFKKLEKKHSIKFTYINVNAKKAFNKVISGAADITASDANRIIVDITKFKTLSIALPITDKQIIGWVVAKDNALLASIMTKYINYTHKTGVFNKYWKDYYGMSYTTYLKMLEYK